MGVVASLGKEFRRRPDLRRLFITMCIGLAAMVVGVVVLAWGLATSPTSPNGRVASFSSTSWIGLFLLVTGGASCWGSIFWGRRRLHRSWSPEARRAAERIHSGFGRPPRA